MNRQEHNRSWEGNVAWKKTRSHVNGCSTKQNDICDRTSITPRGIYLITGQTAKNYGGYCFIISKTKSVLVIIFGGMVVSHAVFTVTMTLPGLKGRTRQACVLKQCLHMKPWEPSPFTTVVVEFVANVSLTWHHCVVELLRLDAIVRCVRFSCVEASLRQHIDVFLDCRVSWRRTVDDTLSQQTLHSDISAYADAWRRALAHAQLYRSHHRCCQQCQRSVRVHATISYTCFTDVSVTYHTSRSMRCSRPDR